MRGRRARTGLVYGLAVLGLAACGGGSDTEGGGPIPNQREGETYPGPRTQVSGTYDLAANGCMFVTADGVSRMAVWPRGATQSKDDGSVVELSDGTKIHPNDAISGPGTVLPVGQLAGFPDGYWGSRVIYCAPDAKDVLVLDAVVVSAR